jgi:hypothetical protein
MTITGRVLAVVYLLSGRIYLYLPDDEPGSSPIYIYIYRERVACQFITTIEIK